MDNKDQTVASIELEYDSQKGYILVTIKGKVTLDTIRNLAAKVAERSKETGCNLILNDMREANIDIPVSGIFDSPKIMDKANISRVTKRVLVIPPTFKEGKFLEDVSQNRGHDLKVFNDYNEAKNWLLAE